MPDDPKKPTNGKGQREQAATETHAGEGGGRDSGNGANGGSARSLWADMSADISLGSPETKVAPKPPEETRAAPRPVKALPPVDLEALAPPPASTVVLMRPCDGVPFEVFMVKRHSKSSFFANAFVYPGGRVEKDDCDSDLARYCRALESEDMARRLGLEHEGLAVGLHVAAIREVYEEAGALLATEGDGKAIDFENPDERDRYETYREILCEDEVDFTQIVGWEDLQLRVEALVPFAHWITPELESKRFDTYFFLLQAPPDQHLRHDDRETTDSFWKTPAQVLADYDAGKVQLAPPTLMTLWRLATFHSIDHALAHYRDRPIPTVMPHPITDAQGRLVLVLPGDPEYPGEVDVPVEGPTRLLLDQGRWWVVEDDEDTTVH